MVHPPKLMLTPNAIFMPTDRPMQTIMTNGEVLADRSLSIIHANIKTIMCYFISIQWRWLMIFMILFFASPLTFANANAVDIRVLIDVSGSMKDNDPQNLRKSALKLVSELLPLGVQSGIWLFAEQPEVLVPVGEVNDRWKKTALSQLKRIHSRGQRTDIEAALAALMVDWSNTDPSVQKHIILLTDGLVDVAVSHNDLADEANAASRQRILQQQIQRLRQLQVKVDVIALSDQVDTELMQALTEQTNGWLEITKTAATLQQAFLRMLEQSAPPTTVPLENNQFVIDGQINEFTVLAFHNQEGAGAITLTKPDASIQTIAKHDRSISWSSEDGYDLVTCVNPEPGTWVLSGSIHPDNRVAILTDLDIASAPMPSTIIAIQPLTIGAWLTDHQRPIDRLDVLKIAQAQAILIAADDATQTYQSSLTLNEDFFTYQGQFAANTLQPGIYHLDITVASPTFQRQLQKNIRVVATPMTIAYQVLDTAPNQGLQATLTIDDDWVDLNSLFGHIQIKDDTDALVGLLNIGAASEPTMIKQLPIKQPGHYHVTARLQALLHNGELITLELPSEAITITQTETPIKKQNEKAPTPPPASTPRQHHESNTAESAATADTQLPEWLLVLLYVTGANVLFGLLLGSALWATRTR
jgi:uncharacterized protein (TIGR03503 family)